MIEAGKVLQNRYRIQKQIGQGGMGAVYVATDERFGSIVAVKETLVLEEQFRKAIEREARLLNSLKHPALPRVSDHFTDENGQFIVMEFIPGSDLSEMMEQSGKPFSVERVLDWADQLLDALDFLHTQEMPVIHRDIKPQNLKLTPPGKIILLDFGLAKGNPTDLDHQTAAKSIFGYSRNYASLEQIQGTGTDPRSDLYSLAATLYHLLTGIPPEDALTRAMHVLSERDDTLKPANVVNPTIPAGVAGVLERALALNSNQRPESAKEMREMFAESDKYALPPNRVKTLTGNPTKAVSAAHNTTPEIFNNQTDVKTKILSSENPRAEQFEILVNGETNAPKFLAVTQINTDAPKRRSTAGAAAVIGSLLVIGAASTAYFVKPDIFTGNPAQNVNQLTTAANSAENTNSETAAVNSNSSTNAPNTATVAVKPNSKANSKNETAAANPKNNKSEQSAGENKKSSSKNDIKIDGETVYMGDTKITDNGIETPDTIIDENGVHPKNPGNPPRVPRAPLTTEQIQQLQQLQQLSPRQKQKLRRTIINRQKNQPDDNDEDN